MEISNISESVNYLMYDKPFLVVSKSFCAYCRNLILSSPPYCLLSTMKCIPRDSLPHPKKKKKLHLHNDKSTQELLNLHKILYDGRLYAEKNTEMLLKIMLHTFLVKTFCRGRSKMFLN